MTELAENILRAFRAHGPASNADIARLLHLPLHETYKVVTALTAKGYLSHPKKQEWGLTIKGKRWLDRRPFKALRLYPVLVPIE